MIVGIFLRNVKTYQGINYIPLSSGSAFCGLLGNNGVGKSSVLEALDTFFNDRAWVFNTVVKKGGKDKTNPHIVPIFILAKNSIHASILESVKLLDNLARTITEENASNEKTKELLTNFISHRDKLLQQNNLDESFIIPIGIDSFGEISLSVFEGRLLNDLLSKHSEQKSSSSEQNENASKAPLYKALYYLKYKIEYLYTPKEITPENFTKLESRETKVLMGESLEEILDRIIGTEKVSEINKSLNEFMDEISEELDGYAYRTPTDRQQYLKKNDVYKLIQQAFFNIRKLHRKHNDNQWLELSLLSSGEKQKAIIDVAHSLLTKHRVGGDELIIAIDEPESSLHMSACFDQFDTLIDISKNCMQVLFTSHWYGFMPTTESGSVTVITKKSNEHKTDLVNLASYREEVKQQTRESRGKLPFDIRIKSINDFIQSIISSTTGDSPFNWIICEGTSERIYINEYLKDLVETKKLRIIPVGGASEVKRVYTYLSTIYKDIESEISGVIYLISDTDAQLVSYPVERHAKLFCKRLVHSPEKSRVTLVNIDSNPISPETEIEHGLNASIYYDTLIDFSHEYPELNFVREIPRPDKNEESFDPLDLKGSEKQIITDFFDKDNNKFRFAKNYIQRIHESIPTPQWIQELRGHF
ncbi:AAA family ATPase [Serratia liquefaciens]|uniref:AAA family ATPase n=1 Tax=Serratia liquefaciens TaxID=614 RepID=UPI003827C511